jgi:Outer membrane protein beta-barrel domain
MTNIRRGSSRVHAGDDGSGRIALIGLFVVLALILAAVKLTAQETPGARGAIRPYVGAYIPTGEQRDFLKDAVLVGAQASWTLDPSVALTASFGWTPSRDKITAGDQKIDAFQYDLGLEGRSAQLSAGALTPFIGAGIGSRTYSYRDLNVDSKTDFDGYGALGFDVGVGPVGIRIEGRDYVSRFQPLTGGGETKTRNDVALVAGLGVRF